MNKKLFSSVILIVLIVGAFFSFNKYMNSKDNTEQSNITDTQTQNSNINREIKVTPIEHATMVLNWSDKIIYVDPVGGVSAFLGQPAPDIILLTDIHSDHLDIETMKAVSKEKTFIIAPMAVADMLPDTIAGTLLVMNNSQKITEQGFNVEAIPMYNLPEKADNYHVKGRGNGYVVEVGDKRVYISGDTSDIPEMRNLKNIEMAFVSMNLPYTMSVESAASGVLAFKPKQIYPYHYRGVKGLSDVNKFKELVNGANPDIQVILLNWYKEKK